MFTARKKGVVVRLVFKKLSAVYTFQGIEEICVFWIGKIKYLRSNGIINIDLDIFSDIDPVSDISDEKV